MAGISKKKVRTKNGTKIKYTITYTDIFGKQHTTGYYDTQSEAKRDLWKFEKVKEGDRIKYGFIFETFLKKILKNNSKGTYTNYKSIYDRYFAQFADFEYSKISSLHWQEIFDNIAKENSPHVSIMALKMAKAAVNHVIKHDFVDKNIFNKIEPPKVPKPDINHLTTEELKLILAACKKIFPEYYALLYTFIGTGAREGEIFALEKTDFCFEKKEIFISKQYTKGRLVDHPKTTHSNRAIYIFDELAFVINEHKKALPPDTNLLFPNNAGGYIRAENFMRRVFKPLLKFCGIKKRIRIHDLRGSYIDMVLSSGLSVKFAQNQVGHSRSETTLDVYAQNNKDMINLATERLNGIFKKTELNLSQKQKWDNKKIIQFPKRQTKEGF